MKAARLFHNPHPGETIKEALGGLGITQFRLSLDTGLPHNRITAIIKGRQGITAVTALRFGKYFGPSRILAQPPAICTTSPPHARNRPPRSNASRR